MITIKESSCPKILYLIHIIHIYITNVVQELLFSAPVHVCDEECCFMNILKYMMYGVRRSFLTRSDPAVLSDINSTLDLSYIQSNWNLETPISSFVFHFFQSF